MDTIEVEAINMTTQREVCVHLRVFKEGLSDIRYKEREQRENPDTLDQLDISSYWSCQTFVSACATASRSLFKMV